MDARHEASCCGACNCGKPQTVLWTHRSSTAGAANIAGFYVGDTRIISRIIPVVNGEAPTAIAWNSPQKGVGVSSMVARNVDGPTVDPSVRIAENRTLEPDACMSDMCCVA